VISTGGLLQLQGLQKSYGHVAAVHDVTLSVQPGEFVTLLGPSGSGKTTSLMMVGGFDVPDRGAIVLDGVDITRVPPHLRSIGVVFQNYALFPHMNVEDNVAFALKMREVPRTQIEARVNEALELVQLGGMDQRLPRQLSGGQQQRVALARAIVFRPSLLLLDEPLGALDRMLREHMQLELRRMHRTLGTTMIYVTHDQDEALVLSDRIVVMNAGKVEQVGTPQQIYEQPATRFVAQFIGETNFLEGRVRAHAGGRAEIEIGQIRFWTELALPHDNGVSIGIVVRPERVMMGRSIEDGTVVTSGVVEDRIYLGDQIKYLIRIPDGTSLIAKETAKADAPDARRGDHVEVSWKTSDCRFMSLAQQPAR
jgi:spermidine/putrescine ABC transporter ATP-binding subunit